MIKFYLAAGFVGFMIGLFVDWIFEWESHKSDNEYIKSLQDAIDSLNDEIKCKEEVIEDQQKIIALQKIAIDACKDVLKAKEIM